MEEMKRSIVQTNDGSHTIKNELTGDTYHSVHGALQESQHVFLKNGLEFFLNQHHAKQVNILEVGFGTGLNALLTLQQHADIQIQYTTLEPYPLPSEIYQELNYNGKDELLALHACDWNEPQKITTNFTLTKLQTTLEHVQLPENFFGVVYFDAFAPSSQPELWTQQAFSKIKDVMAKASVFITYCAKGQVKRDLKSVGFVVESVPGPPGKREMVRAIKQA
jgi:tRNA U34 5-methylaminomethyl-2-thiouridine-forming methyltransferase MnmC